MGRAVSRYKNLGRMVFFYDVTMAKPGETFGVPFVKNLAGLVDKGQEIQMKNVCVS